MADRVPLAWTRDCEWIARSVARDYYLAGGDHQDTLQEARFGVWKALRDYREEMPAAFPHFARLCAKRQVMSGVKVALARKHGPLNDSMRLEQPTPDSDSGTATLGDVIPFRDGEDPLRIILALEAARELLKAISLLSPLERECVERVLLAGEEYAAVGDHKRVDNAIQRARAKLRAVA